MLAVLLRKQIMTQKLVNSEIKLVIKLMANILLLMANILLLYLQEFLKQD